MPLFFRVVISVQEISLLLEGRRKCANGCMCTLVLWGQGTGLLYSQLLLVMGWITLVCLLHVLPSLKLEQISLWMETPSMLPLSPDPGLFPSLPLLREHVISSLFIHYWCCRNPNRLPFIVFSPQTERGRAWSQQDSIRWPAIGPGASPVGARASRSRQYGRWPLWPVSSGHSGFECWRLCQQLVEFGA